MRTIGFIHQKGGTGKTTLAIGTAMALAETGERVLLMDADLQGTASEWGARWGERWSVAVRSQIQPIIHDQAGRFGRTFDWMIVDGPPTVSDMTASIIRAAGDIVVPVRPSWPDIWALEHLFALHASLQTEGQAGGACVVWNQVVQPPTEAMADQVKDWPCFVWPRQIPWDAVWGGLMTGGHLPKGAGDELRAVAERNSA